MAEIIRKKETSLVNDKYTLASLIRLHRNITSTALALNFLTTL